jgi:hypothetical protein
MELVGLAIVPVVMWSANGNVNECIRPCGENITTELHLHFAKDYVIKLIAIRMVVVRRSRRTRRDVTADDNAALAVIKELRLVSIRFEGIEGLYGPKVFHNLSREFWGFSERKIESRGHLR